jgi:hypothetical protein
VTILLADLVASAKAAAGKEDDPSVSDVQWHGLIDKGVKAVFRKLASQFADSWIASVDFTLTAAANVFVMPSNFEQLRHVVKDPTLSGSRRRIDPLNLQTLEEYNGPRYRAMGRQLFMEPPELAAGNFRAWYVPRPMLFAGDFMVRLATTAPIQPTNPSGGPGPGFTLTATANGALSVDATLATFNDRILLNNAAFQNPPTPDVQCGIYVVANPGSGGSKFILTRAADYDQLGQGEIRLWNTILVTAGATLAGQTWQLQAFAGAVDVATQSYGLAVLDPTLEPYNEYIEQYAAMLALKGEKSDASAQMEALAAMDDDLQVMASSQEAGGQIAIADVQEFEIQQSRYWKGWP